jgi:hypothetical protein
LVWIHRGISLNLVKMITFGYLGIDHFQINGDLLLSSSLWYPPELLFPHYDKDRSLVAQNRNITWIVHPEDRVFVNTDQISII